MPTFETNPRVYGTKANPVRKHGRPPIQCELKSMDLRDAEWMGYDAISYTWGNSDQLIPILIKTDSEDCMLLITETCERALQQLCKRFGNNSWFWIDSICINQQDLDEKGPQVSLMGEIYSRARSVHACVGDHADGSEDLFKFALQNHHLVRKYLQNWRKPKCRAHFFSGCEVFQPVSKAMVVFTALRAFLKRGYFRRLWIVQELYLARRVEVYCGADRIEMASLYDLAAAHGDWVECVVDLEADNLLSLEELPRLPVSRRLLEWGAKFQERSTLLPMLHFVRKANLQCRDIRDKCYGILGMVREVVIPDYSNMDTFDVARRVLRAVVTQGPTGGADHGFEAAKIVTDLLELFPGPHNMKTHAVHTAGFAKMIEGRRQVKQDDRTDWSETDRSETDHGLKYGFPAPNDDEQEMLRRMASMHASDEDQVEWLRARNTAVYGYGYRLQRDHTGWHFKEMRSAKIVQISDDASDTLGTHCDALSELIMLPKAAEPGDWCIICLWGRSKRPHQMIVARQMRFFPGKFHLVGLGLGASLELDRCAANRIREFKIWLDSDDYLTSFILSAIVQQPFSLKFLDSNFLGRGLMMHRRSFAESPEQRDDCWGTAEDWQPDVGVKHAQEVIERNSPNMADQKILVLTAGNQLVLEDVNSPE